LYDRNDLNASPAHGEPAEDQDEKSCLVSKWFHQGVLPLFSLLSLVSRSLFNPTVLISLAPTRQLAFFFFVFSYAQENRVYELLGDPLEMLEMLETNTEYRDQTKYLHYVRKYRIDPRWRVLHLPQFPLDLVLLNQSSMSGTNPQNGLRCSLRTALGS
jgi:hypothetical protein